MSGGKVAVTLRRDEARPDGWPMVRLRIEEAPPIEADVSIGIVRTATTQCRAVK